MVKRTFKWLAAIGLIILLSTCAYSMWDEAGNQLALSSRQSPVFDRLDAAWDQVVESVDARMLSDRITLFFEIEAGYPPEKVEQNFGDNVLSLQKQAELLGNAGLASREFQLILGHLKTYSIYDLVERPEETYDWIVRPFAAVIALAALLIFLFLLENVVTYVRSVANARSTNSKLKIGQTLESLAEQTGEEIVLQGQKGQIFEVVAEVTRESLV